MDCSVELDNIYKNNNLKKYGMGVENAYKGVMRFVWPAIGITVAATVAFLCMKGIIPAKKVLSKVPLIGKLFQGDKAAINSVQQSLLFAGTNKATQMGTQAINNIGNKPQQAQPVGNSTVAPDATTQPTTGTQDEQSTPTNTENANNQNGESSTTAPVGSNPEQKTDKAPTIENSVEAQANAKPGDVIQRKNGEKYVLNQGDINWAKQQVQNGKGKETVDQAKQKTLGQQLLKRTFRMKLHLTLINKILMDRQLRQQMVMLNKTMSQTRTLMVLHHKQIINQKIIVKLILTNRQIINRVKVLKT